MRSLITRLLVAAAPLMPLAAPAAEKQESRPVSGVTAVSLSVPMKLVVLQGEREGLMLEGDERALAGIETVVRDGGTLVIRVRKGAQVRGRHKVRGVLNVKRVNALSLAGSGDIVAPELRGDSLKLSIAGSGDIHVGGRMETLTGSISGSGDLRASELEAARVNVDIAGSGDARVWARDSLKVSIAGTGSVRYLGKPEVRKSISGVGSVRPLPAKS